MKRIKFILKKDTAPIIKEIKISLAQLVKEINKPFKRKKYV